MENIVSKKCHSSISWETRTSKDVSTQLQENMTTKAPSTGLIAT